MDGHQGRHGTLQGDGAGYRTWHTWPIAQPLAPRVPVQERIAPRGLVQVVRDAPAVLARLVDGLLHRRHQGGRGLGQRPGARRVPSSAPRSRRDPLLASGASLSVPWERRGRASARCGRTPCLPAPRPCPLLSRSACRDPPGPSGLAQAARAIVALPRHQADGVLHSGAGRLQHFSTPAQILTVTEARSKLDPSPPYSNPPFDD